MQQRQRWFGVIALLFLIVIAYADRVNIAVMLVNPDFLQHFQLGGDRAHRHADDGFCSATACPPCC